MGSGCFCNSCTLVRPGSHDVVAANACPSLLVPSLSLAKLCGHWPNREKCICGNISIQSVLQTGETSWDTHSSNVPALELEGGKNLINVPGFSVD